MFETVGLTILLIGSIELAAKVFHLFTGSRDERLPEGDPFIEDVEQIL